MKHWLSALFFLLTLLFIGLLIGNVEFQAWAFTRHQNQLSWYIRPILIFKKAVIINSNVNNFQLWSQVALIRSRKKLITKKANKTFLRFQSACKKSCS